mmetsp:Transcript_52387/g.117973  ORF Transcript_52387/g.117973 Transcript_52387/m.117973 type:complete len:317 (-) Transcript_52387:318-1268(-)
MAEQTIRLNRPKLNGRCKDTLRQTKTFVLQHISVLIGGEYIYTFKNTADRAVKVHITPVASATEEDENHETAMGMVAIVPAHSGELKIPLKSDSIMVRAGFEHDETGLCEIFWGLRRFDWEPTIVIQFRPEHSHENNNFYADVQPGHPCITNCRSSGSLESRMPLVATLPPQVWSGEPEQSVPVTTELDGLSVSTFRQDSHSLSLSLTPQSAAKSHGQTLRSPFDSMMLMARSMQTLESHGSHSPGTVMSVPPHGFDDIPEADEDEEDDYTVPLTYDHHDWALGHKAREAPSMESLGRPHRGLPRSNPPTVLVMTC